MIDKLTITVVLERFNDGPPLYGMISASNVDPDLDGARLADRVRSMVLDTLRTGKAP